MKHNKRLIDLEDRWPQEVTIPVILTMEQTWHLMQSRWEEFCDALPCCSPSSCCPGKPCRCKSLGSRRPEGPRWGGTNWDRLGWRCSSCGLLWIRTWPRWGLWCPPGGCPACTHSKAQVSGRWEETHSLPWHYAPDMWDMETSEAHEEWTER